MSNFLEAHAKSVSDLDQANAIVDNIHTRDVAISALFVLASKFDLKVAYIDRKSIEEFGRGRPFTDKEWSAISADYGWRNGVEESMDEAAEEMAAYVISELGIG